MSGADREPTIQDLFDLRGKVALVTGGTSHLGSALARALAEAGASVIVASRDADRASAAAAELPRVDPARHAGVALDHMEPDLLERGFDAAVACAGKLDVLINNGHEACPDDWTTVTAEQFTRQLANATGYFLLSRRLRDHAVARSAPASVVLLGSMYGQVGSYPDVYDDVCGASPAAYHALKGGVLQLTRHLAVYWARDSVRVNCLCPGPFPGGGAPPALVDRLRTKVPMNRMGSPHELKGAAVFLASDASSFMTGQALTIDGGWTAW